MCLARLKHDPKSPRDKSPGCYLPPCVRTQLWVQRHRCPATFGKDRAFPAPAVPEGREPRSARMGSREFSPFHGSTTWNSFTAGRGWGEPLRGDSPSLPGLSLSPPRPELNRGSVCAAPSAGGFPPAPGSAALGSAPPFPTQARYCEVTLAGLRREPSAGRASWKGFVGWGEGGDPRPGGRAPGGETASCPKSTPLEKGCSHPSLCRGCTPAWHLPAARLGCHGSLNLVPSLTPGAELCGPGAGRDPGLVKGAGRGPERALRFVGELGWMSCV